MKKIVVTGTRGIPGVMGGVETHCEELFPRLAERGWDVTVVRRSNYVEDGLKEWKGVRLVTLPSPKKKSFEAIIHTFRAINEARRVGGGHLAYPRHRSCFARAVCQNVGDESGIYTSWAGLRP